MLEQHETFTGKKYDLLIIGGGINGAAIARDAAGRGLSVILCEKDDLASHTSSASTKLIHGGFRYLEYLEFRLVRESLKEREVLLRAAPHIIWPLRFILPFEKGLRPAWLIRLGLFLYDNMGGRKLLPPTKTVNVHASGRRGILKNRFKKGFEYSDCWVEDARLVTLNAIDAHEHGATIYTKTEVKSIEKNANGYLATISQNDNLQKIHAKGIVNSAGPWVEEVHYKIKRSQNTAGLRLVKGSHIVTRKLFEGAHSYIFQNADKRVIFAIPYEKDYTLIGTTDNPYEPDGQSIKISEQEISYLCDAASEYFDKPITKDDVVWTYSGVRPLYDDQSEDASAVTRDYVFKLDEISPNAPLLSIYGGKITTSRKLAEHALEKLAPYYSHASGPWTRAAHLPGGDILNADFDKFMTELKPLYPHINETILYHLARRYGTRISRILRANPDSVGRVFGQVLSKAEVDYLVKYEWAKDPEDILWRRTKTGLKMSPEERSSFKIWFSQNYTNTVLGANNV